MADLNALKLSIKKARETSAQKSVSYSDDQALVSAAVDKGISTLPADADMLKASVKKEINVLSVETGDENVDVRGRKYRRSMVTCVTEDGARVVFWTNVAPPVVGEIMLAQCYKLPAQWLHLDKGDNLRLGSSTGTAYQIVGEPMVATVKAVALASAKKLAELRELKAVKELESAE